MYRATDFEEVIVTVTIAEVDHIASAHTHAYASESWWIDYNSPM